MTQTARVPAGGGECGHDAGGRRGRGAREAAEPLQEALEADKPEEEKGEEEENKKTRGAKVERRRKGDPGIGWGAPSEGPERRRR